MPSRYTPDHFHMADDDRCFGDLLADDLLENVADDRLSCYAEEDF